MPDERPRRPRSRGMDEVFGDVLPGTTSDERDDRDNLHERRSDRDRTDDWYRDNRPPHHDR